VLKAQARMFVDINSGTGWHKMAIGLAQCVPGFELTGIDDVVLCVSDDEEVHSDNNKYFRSQVL
jgi:hypothetical protein